MQARNTLIAVNITNRIQDWTFTISDIFKIQQFISIRTLILPLPCSISSRFLFLRSWSKKSSLYDGRCLYSTSQQPNLHQCKININQKNIKQLRQNLQWFLTSSPSAVIPRETSSVFNPVNMVIHIIKSNFTKNATVTKLLNLFSHKCVFALVKLP